jgi:tetratricopeptide (TPR) repeat protein
MRQNTADILIVLLCAFFCLLLYFNSLWGIFIFDDDHSILNNLYIKDAGYIPMFFKGYYTSETEVPQGMFRPLLLLTFSFNYLFSGLQPLGYHIINLLLHFLNAVLFYCLLKLLSSLPGCQVKEGHPGLKKSLPFGLTLSLTLLFLAHPLNTEAVAYISSRSDLMVSIFILLGIIAYLKRRIFSVITFYILGLLSKETALVFFFLILALHFVYYRNVEMPREEKRKLLLLNFFIIGLSVLYWAYRGAVFGLTAKNIILAPLQNPVRSFWSNILTQSGVTLFYLRLFLWPDPLTMHHNFPILNSLSNPWAFFSALAIIIFIGLGWGLRKRHPLISFGILWYLVCLIPKFYASLYVVAAEHHFYLPGFGVYLILAALSKNLYLKFQRKFIIIAIGIISVFSVVVWFRNYEYKNEFIFWSRAVEIDPSSAIAHFNLGVAYATRGLYPESEEEFKKSRVLAPQYAQQLFKNVREQLANIYRLQKRFPQALGQINENIALGFYNFGTYQNLGVIYLDMQNEEKAKEAWEKGLSLNPNAAGIHYNLGVQYLRKKDLAKAKEHLQKAIQLAPDLYSAHFGLGSVLEEEGDTAGAIQAYEKSARLQPKFVDAHYRLGILYAQKSDSRAIRELTITIRLAPDFPEAHISLAVIYAAMQPPQLELAREHTQKTLSLGYKVGADFLKIIGLGQSEQEEK